MGDLKIVLNKRGVAALLSGPEVRADLYRRARAIAQAAGPGHEVSVTVNRRRARASVRTVTPEAMEAESTQHRLTSALDAGRH